MSNHRAVLALALLSHNCQVSRYRRADKFPSSAGALFFVHTTPSYASVQRNHLSIVPHQLCIQCDLLALPSNLPRQDPSLSDFQRITNRKNEIRRPPLRRHGAVHLHGDRRPERQQPRPHAVSDPFFPCNQVLRCCFEKDPRLTHLTGKRDAKRAIQRKSACRAR
jgi:hypothetical protein